MDLRCHICMCPRAEGQGITLGPVLYTHILEPSSFPVSAYKLFMKFDVVRLKFVSYLS